MVTDRDNWKRINDLMNSGGSIDSSKGRVIGTYIHMNQF